jgi:hypothetical protein
VRIDHGASMIIEKAFWVVAIYCDGVLEETLDETFTAKGAEAYCKSFNSERSKLTAEAVRHTTLIEVRDKLGTTKERS